jgi:hypothetical protein
MSQSPIKQVVGGDVKLFRVGLRLHHFIRSGWMMHSSGENRGFDIDYVGRN